MIDRSRFRRFGARARCREVKRVLNGYLDGELASGFAARIAEHLEDCRRCGLDAEVYSRIRESLRERPPTVDEDTLARLREFGSDLTEG